MGIGAPESPPPPAVQHAIRALFISLGPYFAVDFVSISEVRFAREMAREV